jgi:hypothetical protein
LPSGTQNPEEPNYDDTYRIHSEIEDLLAEISQVGIDKCRKKELKRWGIISRDENNNKVFVLKKVKFIKIRLKLDSFC